jgi:uncharacterized membrane protein YkoI
LFGLVLTAAPVTALLAEEKVPLDKLPKPVTDALKDKFPDAKLKKAVKETQGGETIYEVSLTFKDHKYTVECTPEGAIRQIDRELEPKELPAALTRALDDKYPKAHINFIEEVTLKDKIERYEVTIVTADKKEIEVHLAPDGKILKEVNKDK